jgi:large subunit ribosomal protein L31
MAKKSNIHPKYKKITVILTNGEVFQTRSTFPGEKIILDIDRTIHPAWQKNKSNFINTAATTVSKFKNTYGNGIDFTRISSNKNQED